LDFGVLEPARAFARVLAGGYQRVVSQRDRFADFGGQRTGGLNVAILVGMASGGESGGGIVERQLGAPLGVRFGAGARQIGPRGSGAPRQQDRTQASR